MSIRITTLGTLRVTQGDRLLTSLPAQRMRLAMLVHLAVVRETTRDRLLGMFWPERTEDRARHALSQTLYELRRTLGDNAITIHGERVYVESAVTIDLVAFDSAVDDGNYDAALSLYRGPFLDGFMLPAAVGFEAWLDNQRLRAQRQHRRARRERIRQHVDAANIREALIAAREWVAIDPGDDEGQHRLIELLSETGDRAGAIRQFEAYERLLQSDDLVPLDETRELIARVRAGDVGEMPGSSLASSIPEPARPAHVAVSRGEAGTGSAAAAAAPETGRSAAAGSAGAIEPGTGTARTGRSERGGLRLGWLIAAGVVALIAAGLAIVLNPPTAPTGVALADPENQIAVLYMQDLSPPPGASYLAAAVTETLIAEFSNLEPELGVRSSAAVSRFRGRDVTPDSIGRALDVDLLVTGDVSATDDAVRVRVRLVEAATGSVVASQTIEERDGEYFTLLDNVVEGVANLLRREIGARIDSQERRLGTQNENAWVLLQQAAEIQRTLPHLVGAPEAGRSTHLRADSILAVAAALDPGWHEPVLERARLAEVRAIIEYRAGAHDAARKWMDKADRLASGILERKPRNPAALELRGRIALRQAQFLASVEEDRVALVDRAQSDLTAATEADPRRASALALLSDLLFSEGRFAEANLAARNAVRADAFLSSTSTTLYHIAMTEFEMGHDAEAAERCDEGLRRYRDPHFAYCALTVMAWSSRPALPDSAWSIAGLVPYASEGSPTVRPALDMLVAAVLQRAGLQDSATAVIARTRDLPAASTAGDWIEAVIRHRMGQQDQAAATFRDILDSDAQGNLTRLRAVQPLLDRAIEGR